MGTTVEIFFRDLSHKKQKEVLRACNVAKSEDMNWDVQPVAILEFEPETTEEELKPE